MAFTTTSPNMLLTLPVVNQEPGPLYASDVNTSLGLIDSHDHSLNKGVQITPAGMNITSDLTFIGNNAIALRSVRFSSQSATLSGAQDLGCLYVVGNELYYNDFLEGHLIQITNNGSVNAGAGSITGLGAGGSFPNAAAIYNGINSTFVWQSNSTNSTPANLDCASIFLRNLSAGSFYYEISPPTLASNVSVVLPQLPVAQSFLTIDASGNITTPIPYTGGITGSNIAATTITAANIANTTITAAQIANSTITATQIANSTITTTQLAGGIDPSFLDSESGNFFITSGSSGTFSQGVGGPVTVTGIGTVTLTAVGGNRPVFMCFPTGSITIPSGCAGTFTFFVQNSGHSSTIGSMPFSNSASNTIILPASILNSVNLFLPALGGTGNKYTLQVTVTSGTVTVTNATMQVFQV